MPPSLPNSTDVSFLGTSYTNLTPYHVTNDVGNLRIQGAPFPYVMVITLNAIFILFSAGWVYIVQHVGLPNERWQATFAGTGIGLFTCLGYTSAVYFTYRQASQKGPLLIYDHQTKNVSLPRIGRIFPVSLVRLQTLEPKWQHESDGGSELQLRHHPPNDNPETFLLVTSIARSSVFEQLLRPIRQFTPIEVVHIPMTGRNQPSERRR